MENERKMQNDENKIEENRDWNTKGYYKISKRHKEVKKRYKNNF